MEEDSLEKIAVIGMAGRFPDADNVSEFWRNICNGKESIRSFSDDELTKAGVDIEEMQRSSFVNAGIVIEDSDKFDAKFFGYNPAEAKLIDPQHRVFLECAWAAFEDAGYDVSNGNSPVGVFAGASMNDYYRLVLQAQEEPDLIQTYQQMLGNDKDYLATRVAYKFNLTGPAFTVQTACSSSSVAIVQAWQSLMNFQCDMALAGGVCVNVPQGRGYHYHEGMILSPDGHCRAFDAEGKGIVAGQGAGAVVLKRLSEALEDNDNIYSVITGASVNNDGARKVGFTAPSVDGQAQVIEAALAWEDIDPSSIQYVEAHGTGTPLGDPIEIAALKKVYEKHTDKKQFCGIGSVKTNIGHLDAAAGVVGFIKASLAVRDGLIPPSLNYSKPNPQISFEDSPFYVNTKLKDWPIGDSPRRAGVSSFGIGGTNAHIIVEQPPVAPNLLTAPAVDFSEQVFSLPLSADSWPALTQACSNLLEKLRDLPFDQYGRVEHTLQVGRKAFDCRCCVVGQPAELIDQLGVLCKKGFKGATKAISRQNIVFIYPGQGAQYVNMGRDLYVTEPVFKESLEKCAVIFNKYTKMDLMEILYPDQESEASSVLLKQTNITQPAIFSISVALTDLWLSRGVSPVAVIGHSIGEYAAAYAAGVFSLEDAMRIVVRRGELMEALPSGGMLSVPLPIVELKKKLCGSLSIAACNSPSLSVVSGEREEIEKYKTELEKSNIECRLLHTSHAFHSNMMLPIIDKFRHDASQISFSPASTAFISTVTGDLVDGELICDPEYWCKNLMQTVRFSDAVLSTSELDNVTFIEIGPGNTLCTFVGGHGKQLSSSTAVNSLRHPLAKDNDFKYFAQSIASLWVVGVDIDWTVGQSAGVVKKISLPTYPFQRERYWISDSKNRSVNNLPIPKIKTGVDDWYYFPSWKKLEKISSQIQSDDTVFSLLVLIEKRRNEQLHKAFKSRGYETISVVDGRQFVQISKESYSFDLHSMGDFKRFIGEVNLNGHIKVVNCLGLNTLGTNSPVVTQQNQYLFWNLSVLTRCFGESSSADQISVDVVVSNMHGINDLDPINLDNVTALGITKTAPQEYANINMRVIDVDAESGSLALDFDAIVNEVLNPEFKGTISLRGKSRWLQTYEAFKGHSTSTDSLIREGGTYLVTGGLGNVGRQIIGYLLSKHNAKIIITGRSARSHAEVFDILDRDESLAFQVDMHVHDRNIVYLDGDIGDKNDLSNVLRNGQNKFGPLNGVFHVAGLIDSINNQLIPDLQKSNYELQANPKINGIANLGNAIESSEIDANMMDFCFVSSSLSSILGGIGFASYAGVNAYLDSYVFIKNQENVFPWICMNWDGWRFEEEVGKHSENAAKRAAGIEGMSPQEGLQTLEFALRKYNETQIIVSTSSLDQRYEKWMLGTNNILQQDNGNGLSEISSEPAAGTVSEQVEISQTEQTVMNVWFAVLDCDSLDLDDDFFDLGGHSLMAMGVFSKIQQLCGVRTTLSDLLEGSTVAEYAKTIEQKSLRNAKGINHLPSTDQNHLVG